MPSEFTPDDFLSAIKAVAAELSLPGRSLSTSAGGSSPDVSNVVALRRTAPSLAVLTQLMEGMPNPDTMDRDGQIAVAGAVKGAVAETEFEAEGRDLFLLWSGKWFATNPTEDARIFDTLGAPKNDWKSLLRICRDLDPNHFQDIRCAMANEVFSTQPLSVSQVDAIAAQMARRNSAHALTNMVLSPVSVPAAASIPPRQWLYGYILIAGSLSLTVAPGGTGKSMLTMSEAVAMASGKTLFPGDAPQRPLRVWVHNEEDPQDELDRRLAAIMKQQALTVADLGGRLFVTSGRDNGICLAKTVAGEPRVEPSVEDKLVELIKFNGIDVLVLDPLGATHALPENDNTAVNVLLGALRRIMDQTNVAIQAVHHTGKQAASDMKGSGAAAARGASAWVDGARNVRQLARMTEKEAATFGIAADEAFKYVRVDNGKANLAPAARAVWRKIEPVSLNKATSEYPQGDSVGVPVEWTPPKSMASTATASDLQRVQTAIFNTQQPLRENAQSPDWVGYLVAEVLGLDVGESNSNTNGRTPEQNRARADVKALVKNWINMDGLVKAEEQNPDRRKGGDITVIRVGQPATCLDAPAGESSAVQAA